jgi:hypothetical protein
MIALDRAVAAHKSLKRTQRAAAGPGDVIHPGPSDEGPSHLSDDDETLDEEDENVLEANASPAASFPGLTLSLADVPMTTEDLIGIVDLLSNAKSKIRSLSLTALETPVGLAKQTVGQLTKLLSRQRSLIELQISDLCELTRVHVLVLQQALDENINLAVKAAQRRRERRQQRAEQMQAMRDQDRLDFFYWENTGRAGLMQLESSQRQVLTKQSRAQVKLMASGAQLVYMQKMHAKQRQDAQDECRELKATVAAQWCSQSWLPLCIAKVAADEAVFRDSINSQLAGALDQLFVAKREHYKQCQTALLLRQNIQLGFRAKVMRDERMARVRIRGFHLGHYVAWKMLASLRGIGGGLWSSQKQTSKRKESSGASSPSAQAAAATLVAPSTGGRSPEPLVAMEAVGSGKIDGNIRVALPTDDELDETIGSDMIEAMRRRSVGGSDVATKIVRIVRAKSIASKSTSMFVDLVEPEYSEPTAPAVAVPSDSDNSQPPVLETDESLASTLRTEPQPLQGGDDLM